MKKIFIAASVAALALTSCRENDSMVESSNFGMNAVSAADYNVSGLPVTTVMMEDGMFLQETQEISKDLGLSINFSPLSLFF